MPDAKTKSKEIMILLRADSGFVLKAYRVMVPTFTEQGFYREARTREGFSNREYKRWQEKKACAHYIVHHDLRDYESFQGMWDRVSQSTDGAPPPRSDDQNFIRIHNALIPYPTFQGMFEFYKEIGFNHRLNKYDPDCYTMRLEKDKEFRRTEMHRAEFNARA
jgi:hypothetical protein